MNLYDEEEVRNKREKNKKIKKYITLSIIAIIIFIFILMGVIFYLIYNPNKITIKVNGKEDEKLEKILITEVSEKDDTKNMYFPIRELAGFSNYWTYNSFNGDFTANTEDENNCYIRSEKEIVIFKLGSNTIYKIDLEQQSNSGNGYEFEEINIKNPVIKRNENLYLDLEGVQKSFNLQLKYNEKQKKIEMTTLNNLINQAKNIVDSNKDQFGKMDESFINQRALIDNMIVVESSGNNRMKGVIGITRNSNGRVQIEEILGLQYEDIKYIPQKQLFIVKRNNKVGIMGITGTNKTKIEIIYDSLNLIDDENDLYLAQIDKRYGIIDINQNTIIHMDYDKIGVDIGSYSKNGIKNGYILVNSLIPVQQNNKWGFYKLNIRTNSEGVKVIQCGLMNTGITYDKIGCITNKRSSTVSNLLDIEDYGVVVVCRNNKYGFLETTGQEVPLQFTDMYMETSGGETKYYMEDLSEKAYNIISSLEKFGISKKTNN